MSAAACAPTRLGMSFTFAADRLAPLPPPPPPAEPAVEQEMVIDGAGEEGLVHPQLWLACAGSMCTVPPVGAAVYYFPQGHAEQAAGPVADLSAARGIPPLIPCRVAAVRYMAEPNTDEVFAKIRLVPLRPGEPVADVGVAAGNDQHQQDPKPASFAKTLTQSDANNGGGFSVPRFCAETIFPELDYRAEPPVQSVQARDVHGAEWTFRHIYRGTPRRHLLTTGWSNFVNRKKLLAGDSIVFLRGDNGRVHVGLRRAKRGGGVFAGGDGWGDAAAYGGARGNAGGGGKVPPEDVVAAARLAAAGQPFEVVHYPRASTPEFCVRADTVRASMQVPWCPGMRFKMAFETEDSSRISWFMGTIAAVKPADANRWPQSPWRLLQVTWDEPELLQNVQRVCPWLVEQVSSMPNLHLPNFAPPPPRKKPRIPELPFEAAHHPLFDHHPGFLAPHHQNHHGLVPFLPFPDGSAAAAGIQGARHAQVAPPLFPDLLANNLHQTLLFCGGFRPAPAADHHAPPPTISTDLAIGIPTPPRHDAPPPRSPSDDAKPAVIMLFGQAILTGEQITSNGETSPPPAAAGKGSPAGSGSGSGVTDGSPVKNNSFWTGDNDSPSECKVFVESDAVGRSLDLSALGSFEELCACLSAMFCIDDSADLRSHLLYRTAAGEEKHAGDEPFSTFVKSARRITILSGDAGSDNTGSQ